MYIFFFSVVLRLPGHVLDRVQVLYPTHHSTGTGYDDISKIKPNYLTNDIYKCIFIAKC